MHDVTMLADFSIFLSGSSKTIFRQNSILQSYGGSFFLFYLLLFYCFFVYFKTRGFSRNCFLSNKRRAIDAKRNQLLLRFINNIK